MSRRSRPVDSLPKLKDLTEEGVAARLQDVEFMAASGEEFGRAATRLGMTRTALEKWLRDNGRVDLVTTMGGFRK